MWSKKTAVLVIDDEEDFLELVECNLKLDGFKVYKATNGPKGLEIAFKKQPAVILLDRTMPEMDGLDVLKEIKSDDRTKDSLVFMLTAKTLMGEVEKAFDFGADDYITKPVQITSLGEIIRTKQEKIEEKKEAKRQKSKEAQGKKGS